MSEGGAPAPRVRTGQGEVKLSREEFARRLGERFADPAFDAVRGEIERIVEVAWEGYDEYRKSPRTRPAGPGFADPEFELPVEWLAAREAIREAEARHRDGAGISRSSVASVASPWARSQSPSWTSDGGRPAARHRRSRLA